MGFSVSTEQFSGPLAVLLDLLNENELSITEVSLAKIADDYLDYIEKHEVPTEEMADFLVVASRLIYLKSRELMPYLQSEEEDEQVATLEDQLRTYRLFMQAAERLEQAFAGTKRIYKQPKSRIVKKEQKVVFSAPENVNPQTLHEAFRRLLKRLAPFFALAEASIERVKSVEERIGELKGAIMTRASVRFKEIMKSAKSKPEVVVSFLALLELVRRNIVTVTQEQDHDILIEKV